MQTFPTHFASQVSVDWCLLFVFFRAFHLLLSPIRQLLMHTFRWLTASIIPRIKEKCCEHLSVDWLAFNSFSVCDREYVLSFYHFTFRSSAYYEMYIQRSQRTHECAEMKKKCVKSAVRTYKIYHKHLVQTIPNIHIFYSDFKKLLIRLDSRLKMKSWQIPLLLTRLYLLRISTAAPIKLYVISSS